jgi:hypothetical protein
VLDWTVSCIVVAGEENRDSSNAPLLLITCILFGSFETGDNSNALIFMGIYKYVLSLDFVCHPFFLLLCADVCLMSYMTFSFTTGFSQFKMEISGNNKN